MGQKGRHKQEGDCDECGQYGSVYKSDFWEGYLCSKCYDTMYHRYIRCQRYSLVPSDATALAQALLDILAQGPLRGLWLAMLPEQQTVMRREWATSIQTCFDKWAFHNAPVRQTDQHQEPSIRETVEAYAQFVSFVTCRHKEERV